MYLDPGIATGLSRRTAVLLLPCCASNVMLRVELYLYLYAYILRAGYIMFLHPVFSLYSRTNCTITKYSSGDQIEKNEMGRACGTCGEGERYIQDFSRET
jgi:hypothetical protein